MSIQKSNRANGPVWARPAPGARRPRFSREQIARTAIAIADSEGIDALSMRRIATELDTGPMSLYNYVPKKRDLFALMEDELLGEVIADSMLPTDWRDALRLFGQRMYALWRRHPWAVLSLDNTYIGPNGMRLFEQTLAALADAEIDGAEKIELILLVNNFVGGMVLPANSADATATDVVDDAVAFFADQLKSGDFPHISVATAGSDGVVLVQEVYDQQSAQARFDRGLERLLDGIAVDLERRRKPQTTGTRGRTRRAR